MSKVLEHRTHTRMAAEITRDIGNAARQALTALKNLSEFAADDDFRIPGRQCQKLLDELAECARPTDKRLCQLLQRVKDHLDSDLHDGSDEDGISWGEPLPYSVLDYLFPAN